MATVLRFAVLIGCLCVIAINTVASACPPDMCDIYCPNGYVKDANGCNTCDCNTKRVCPEHKCTKLCSNGNVLKNNCPTCECNP